MLVVDGRDGSEGEDSSEGDGEDGTEGNDSGPEGEDGSEGDYSCGGNDGMGCSPVYTLRCCSCGETLSLRGMPVAVVAAPQKKPAGHDPLQEEPDWERTVVLSDHLPGAHGKGKSSSKGPFVIVVTYWLRVSGYRVRFHGC